MVRYGDVSAARFDDVGDAHLLSPTGQPHQNCVLFRGRGCPRGPRKPVGATGCSLIRCRFGTNHLTIQCLGDVKRKAGVRSTLNACGVPVKPVGLMGCFRSETKPCGLSRTPYRLASSIKSPSCKVKEIPPYCGFPIDALWAL